MGILILNRSAYYPYNEWLGPLKEELFLFTTKERAEASVEFEHVEGFNEYEINDSIEVRAIEFYRKYPFHTVIATSEFDILRAARIRDYLDLAGQNVVSALTYRNKVIMKETLIRHQIPVPNFVRAQSAIDIYKFIETNGYPIVIKPFDGSGSVGVEIIYSVEDLYDYLSKGLNSNLEVEQFIEGDMYHIDGIVLSGELEFCWPSKYINGCLAHQDSKFNGSFLLGQDNPLTGRLIQFIKDVIKALPTPSNTSFHAEVFHTLDDKLVFCEIASRTGGGFIRETIIQAFDLDLTKTSIQAQCGIISELNMKATPNIYSGFLLVPSQKGKLINIPDSCNASWVTKYEIDAKPGDFFDGSSSSVDTIAKFLIIGSSESEVHSRINQLALWFEKNTLWE